MKTLELRSNCNPFKLAKQADGETPYCFAVDNGHPGKRFFYRIENHNGILVVK